MGRTIEGPTSDNDWKGVEVAAFQRQQPREGSRLYSRHGGQTLQYVLSRLIYSRVLHKFRV